MRDLIFLKLSRKWFLTDSSQRISFCLAYELHQLAGTSNEYFSIVLDFLRSSMGTRYLKIVLETSPDRRRSGAWEILGKTKFTTHCLIIRIILGRLYGLMTSLVPLSRRIQIIKDVLFTKVSIPTRVSNKVCKVKLRQGSDPKISGSDGSLHKLKKTMFDTRFASHTPFRL
jgi:hypothetical protein